MGLRAYIDTQMTGALKITRLVAPDVNPYSEDDEGAPVNVEFGLPHKNRPKVPPYRENGRAQGVRYCRRARIRGCSISRAISKMRRYPTGGRAF